MKRSMFWILVFGLSLVSLAHGQTNTNAGPAVKGKGTPDFIPVWTSDRSIGNSVMFQSGGDIGVGTTTPQAGLDVETGELFGIRGSHK